MNNFTMVNKGLRQVRTQKLLKVAWRNRHSSSELAWLMYSVWSAVVPSPGSAGHAEGDMHCSTGS